MVGDDITIILSKKEAKALSDDLRELERHFDLDTFCESDDHPIGRFIETLRKKLKHESV